MRYEGRGRERTKERRQGGGRRLTRLISCECVHCVGFRLPKKTILGKFRHCGDFCTDPPPFSDEGQIWCAKADPRSTLTCQISSECVHCVGFRWPKTTIWANFDFLGLPYRSPFTDDGQIWCGIVSMVYAYKPKFVSIGLFCCPLVAKTPNFCRFCRFLPFFGLRHLVMSPVVINLRKLSTGAQLQTFPYATASKSFLYSNAVMAKSGAQTLTFKSVTNRQTNKKLNVFGRPGGG